MKELIAVLYTVLQIVLSVYGLYFGIISICCLLKKKPLPEPERMLRFAVLVPARNEECCIAGIMESVKRQNYPPVLVDVYVIPNNCTDRTAEAAEEAGANVLQVSDSVHSKGQALHETFDLLLEQGDHDAYCVFDADNELHPDFLREMNRALCGGARVAKSRILAKNVHESWVCACYDTYFCNANSMLNGARSKVNLSARVIGTGFAVSRELMEDLDGWNTQTLTEDAEFYAMLAARGEKIAYVPGAITYDEEPLSFSESLTQRRRWMSGVMLVGRKKMQVLLRGCFVGTGKRFAFDALMQFAIAWLNALIIPVFLLWAFCFPEIALPQLPGVVLKFYSATLFTGVAALYLEGRQRKHRVSDLALYPLFIFSFMPLQTFSLFFPNKRWKPIHHTGVRLRDGAADSLSGVPKP